VRIGEALGVLWEDLDRDPDEVDYTHQVQRIKGEGLVRVPVKTEVGEAGSAPT
jgi:integrase